MSRLFVIGTGPLIQPGVTNFSGQCLRTNHFVEPLLEAGHTVHLFAHPISDRAWVDSNGKPDVICEAVRFKEFNYNLLHCNGDEWLIPYLQRACDKFNPDAILGINPFPSYLACKIRSRVPVWCDLNGYAMAEGQTRAYVYDSDECLSHFLKHEKATVRRADRISTVSTPQKYALLGELAMVGRLNKYNFSENLVTVIPNAVNPHYLDPGERHTGDDGFFRVLWSGGYNTWTDVEMLYNGLCGAMETHPELRFVSTGGILEGHDEKTYLRFQELVRNSPLRERFDLRGWVPFAVADELLMQCDLGINIDAKNYETVFGARNRITTMMACGMPVLTTVGTEITQQIQQENLGLFIDPGDVSGLTEALQYAAGHREELRTLGMLSRKYALANFLPDITLAPLLKWADSPDCAMDNLRRFSIAEAKGTEPEFLNAIEEEYQQLEENPLHELLADRRDLRLIRGKKIFQLYKKIKSIFGADKK